MKPMAHVSILILLATVGPEAWGVGRGGGGGGARPAPAARPAPRPAPSFTTGQGQTGGLRMDGPRPGQGTNLKNSSAGGKAAPNYVPGHANDGGLGNLSQQTTTRRAGGTSYVANSTLAGTGGRVRENFTNVNAFNNQGWWSRHPNAWRPVAWNRNDPFWAWTSWSALSAFCGYPSVPIYYDYGSTVVYQGDSVFVYGESAGSQEAYAQQASAIAVTGGQAQASPDDSWLPLGVFAMVQNDQSDTSKLFQLAVSKTGVIRGNYYDALTDTTLPVSGQVDKKSQRAAWYVGDKKDIIYEAGAYNLSQDQTTMLVHLGKDQTQQWTLVRLPQPPGS